MTIEATDSPERGNVHGTEVRSRGLVRNTFFNLLTQIFLVVLALWSMPILVRGLSKESFGLLTVVWTLVGYFTLLDFGIGRANTKLLAEAVAAGDGERVLKLVRNSLFLSVALGLVSAGLVYLFIPVLVTQVFKIDASLVPEATLAFTIVALSIPFTLLFSVVRGFQMALHRFDLVNAGLVVLGIGQWVGSVVLLWFGFGLWEIVFLTVTVRVALAIVFLVQLSTLFPKIWRTWKFWDRLTLGRIASFGGWLTVSQVLSPLFLYLDRFIIGGFLSLEALSYYAVSQEALTRLLIIPMSLTTTLYPTLSERSPLGEPGKSSAGLYFRSVKYVVLVMVPATLVLIIFSGDILRLWIGEEFARNSSLPFQILSIGLFFNALAQVPTTALHAFGRPDLTGKFHLLELPVMVGLDLALIPWIGIVGAAIAWSTRVLLDAGLLFRGAHKYVGKFFVRSGIIQSGAGIAVHLLWMTGAVISVFFVHTLAMRISITCIWSVFYIAGAWLYSFDELDRGFFVQLRSRLLK